VLTGIRNALGASGTALVKVNIRRVGHGSELDVLEHSGDICRTP
jgi:hypothetical protein